jgi:hypothetical protein
MPDNEQRHIVRDAGSWQNILMDMMRNLVSGQQELDRRLTEHMKNEEEGMKKIHEHLQKVLTAMPEKENGEVDVYGHRDDHAYVRGRRGFSRKAYGAMIEKLVQVGVMVAVYFLFSGKLEHFIMEMSK